MNFSFFFLLKNNHCIYHGQVFVFRCVVVFKVVKKCKEKQLKRFDSVHIFVEIIDCGYTLWSPRPGGSNGYPQSVFWTKNKKMTGLLYKSWGYGGILVMDMMC